MTPTEVRQAAADLIEENGWTRGTFHRGGRFCVVGALRQAAGGSIWAVLEARPAADELRQELFEKGVLLDGGLGFWNDDPKRTKAEVIAALRGTS